MMFTTTILGLASLASLAVAQAPVACPTATQTIQNRECNKRCPLSDCAFFSTIRQPCNCPAAIPTATLIAPCAADCPYQGCDIVFRTSSLACPTPTSTRRVTTTSTRRTTSTTPTRTSVPIQTTTVITSVVTLPPRITTTSTTSTIPCPTVTRITTPADCPVIRCPVPTCQVRTTQVVPCNCQPRTVLWVQGCPTACADGCLTRTETASIAC
ncbi:hypothetical protein QBC40DRAFT_291405 [Triangularia verruculosa]|uniref:Uncharacterized protein n=1 Tax=Triangularia verruculosa TaxID=2587418 RepID=A0AAN6X8L3_9PEZI|nr:hypothetical protein QBC40DRAFT_291405 [Triangularia verruculosa]